MKNWASQGVTNLLLLINAVLLLTLVVNSSSQIKHRSPHDNLSEMGDVPTDHNQMINPHESSDENMEAQAPKTDAGFDFKNMIFAALRCPSDGTVSLADISCKGEKAETTKDFVASLSEQNLPPRILFDKIIEKFGEKALTDEALEIRKNNRTK